MIIYDRKTEKTMMGGVITFDRTHQRTIHVRLNIMAINMMAVTRSDYVRFLKIGDDWFVSKASPDEGYRLSPAGKGLRVNSTYFVIDFLGAMRIKSPSASFKIKRTPNEYQGNTLFQIIT